VSGTVAFVCVSERKGIPKRAVDRVRLLPSEGVEHDAHAGHPYRQVSILDETDIEEARAKGVDLRPGAFGENVVLRGVDLAALGIGSRLAIGDAELEVTQVGKACHTRCSIYDATGDCVMARRGVFARVARGGEVVCGAPVAVLEIVPRAIVQAAVLTVSDRCAAGATRDTAGPATAELAASRLGARIAWSGVVPDERDGIAQVLRELADRDLALVLTVGGTGLSARDVTPEATRSVVERDVPGLAEAMRVSSSVVSPNAWLSRGVCGVRRRTLIVNLPGSRTAATENLAAILPILPHALEVLRGDAAHARADEERATAAGRAPAVCP
jgi:molybdopterin adenylyltransferase